MLRVAFLLLGVAFLAEARNVSIADSTTSAKITVAGSGAFCYDLKRYPVKTLEPMKSLKENCPILKFLGTAVTQQMTTTTSSITIVTYWSKGKCVDEEKEAVVTGSGSTLHPEPLRADNHRFNLTEKLANELDKSTHGFEDCMTETACLNLMVQDNTRGVFRSFAQQPFRFGGSCEKKLEGGDVAFEAKPAITEGGDLILDEGPDSTGKIVSSFNLNKVFNELSISVSNGGLPALPSFENEIRFPRGFIVYATRREIGQCMRKEADITNEDEFLAYLPFDKELADGATSPLDLDKKIVFSSGPGGKCPICGKVQLVVVWDWLRRKRPTDQCRGYKTFTVNIACTAAMKDVYRFDIIPYYKDQGLTTWVRKCIGGEKPSVMRMDQGWKGEKLWREGEDGETERKGVMRLFILAKIFNALPSCPTIRDNVDDVTIQTRAQMDPKCMAMLKELVNNTAMDLVEDRALLKAVVANCSNSDFVRNVFAESSSWEDNIEALKNGACPDRGFGDIDEFAGDGKDLAALMFRRMLKRRSWNKGVICEREEPQDQCGYRLIAALMKTPKRLLYNKDLVEHMQAEDEHRKLEDVVQDLREPASLGTIDLSYLKDCPQPDKMEPVDAMPATWKFMDDGRLMRGFFNTFEGLYCYLPVMTLKCESCGPTDPFPDETSGTNPDEDASGMN